MTRHKPTKAAYKLLGADVSTEITFELPSTRFENITGTFLGRRIDVVGLTTCTPVDANTTQVTQTFYWPAWLGFIKPFFWALGPTFLSDDRRMVELQREGLKFDPRLMLIQDADMPAMWYHRLKKAWAAIHRHRRTLRQSAQGDDAALEELTPICGLHRRREARQQRFDHRLVGFLATHVGAGIAVDQHPLPLAGNRRPSSTSFHPIRCATASAPAGP